MNDKNWLSRIHLHREKIIHGSDGKQDGVIKYICENIAIKNKFCIEIGFGSEELYSALDCSNIANLIITKKWNNLLLDKEHENHSCNLYKEFITSDNICNIFKQHDVPLEPGYISINFSTTSLWITDKILDKYKPSFFSIKFNPSIPIDYAITFPNDPKETWDSDRVMGASLKAIDLMVKSHNYSLVYAGDYKLDEHHDAFFVRDDLLGSLKKPNINDFKHAIQNVYPSCTTGRSKIMMDYETWLKTKDESASKQKALKISKSHLEAGLFEYFKVKIYHLKPYLIEKIKDTVWLYKIIKKITRPKRYFYSYPRNIHLDIRYGKKNTPPKEIKKELIRLLAFFSKLCAEHNIKPILFHGSLIGYYFNKQILPWDDDIDIKLLGDSIDNMKKLHKYESENIIIKINPNCSNRSTPDKDNVIDARVISKKNGVFIDITFLTPTDDEKIVRCKSPHYYDIKDINPLKKTKFEGITVYVPNNIEKILVDNYGQNVLTPSNLDGWKFKDGRWVR